MAHEKRRSSRRATRLVDRVGQPGSKWVEGTGRAAFSAGLLRVRCHCFHLFSLIELGESPFSWGVCYLFFIPVPG